MSGLQFFLATSVSIEGGAAMEGARVVSGSTSGGRAVLRGGGSVGFSMVSVESSVRLGRRPLIITQYTAGRAWSVRKHAVLACEGISSRVLRRRETCGRRPARGRPPATRGARGHVAASPGKSRAREISRGGPATL